MEALRRLAGGPKLEAAKACAEFVAWAAAYTPPSRFSLLEIDGVAKPRVFQAPEEARATGGVIGKCRRCSCKADASGLCHHCIFGEECPHTGAEEPTGSRWSFLEVDNVDHDAVADGVVMAFFAIRGGLGAKD